MREYYDQIWLRLPDQLHEYWSKQRLEFLFGSLKDDDSILDYGCGAGFFSEQLRLHGYTVASCDISPVALQRANNLYPKLDLQVVCEDGVLQYSDNSFDVIWLSEVVAHVFDTAKLFSELRRVLKPNGRILLTTPANSFWLRIYKLVLRPNKYLDPCFMRHFYTRKILQGLAQDFGFEVSHLRIRRRFGKESLIFASLTRR